MIFNKISFMIILILLVSVIYADNTPLYTFTGQYSGTGDKDTYTETIKTTRYIDTPTIHLKKYGCCSHCESVSLSISGVIGGYISMSGFDEKWYVGQDMLVGSHNVKIEYNCNYLVEIYEALTPPFSISGAATWNQFRYEDRFIVEFPKKAVYKIDFGLENGEYSTTINYEDIQVKEPKSIEREMDVGKQEIEIKPGTTNTKWSLTISEPMTCSETCPTGQLQKPAPNCTCYTPTCEPPCPAGKSQKPYPECTCYIPSEEPKTPTENASAGNVCQTTCPTNYTQKSYPDCSCEQISQCTQDADCVNKGLGDKCVNNNCMYSQKGGVPCLGSLFFIFLGTLIVIFSKQKV